MAHDYSTYIAYRDNLLLRLLLVLSPLLLRAQAFKLVEVV